MCRAHKLARFLPSKHQVFLPINSTQLQTVCCQPTDEYESAILEVLLQNDRLIEDNIVALKLPTVVRRVDDLLLLLAFPQTTDKGAPIMSLVCLTTGGWGGGGLVCERGGGGGGREW